jgi:GABA(A) receptor-associated protein
MKSYKSLKSFEERKKECENLKSKFQDRYPVIIEPRSSYPSKLDKTKFLIPGDVQIMQVLHLVRRRSSVSAETGIFIFVDSNVMLPTTATIESISKEHTNDDGFIYFTVAGEDTYGG